MSLATMEDIAEAVGVSLTTVSRILNGNPGFSYSEETRAKVVSTAERLGYTPSALGRALSLGRTRIVGIGCQRPDDPHPSPTLAALTRLARNRGYEILLHPSAWEDDFEEALDLLRGGMVDVYMAIHGNWRLVEKLASAAEGSHQIVVFAGPLNERLSERIPAAGWSEAEAMSLALNHLVSLGHRRVAFLVGGSEGTGKWHSLRKVLDHPDVLITPVEGEELDDKLELGAELARHALELSPAPTAMFARSDELAMGALPVLQEKGVRVPEDMSVIGYGNVPMTAHTVPKLSTVATPYVESAEFVFQRALDCLEGVEEDAVSRHRVFRPRLVQRASTGPPGRSMTQGRDGNGASTRIHPH